MLDLSMFHHTLCHCDLPRPFAKKAGDVEMAPPSRRDGFLSTFFKVTSRVIARELPASKAMRLSPHDFERAGHS